MACIGSHPPIGSISAFLWNATSLNLDHLAFLARWFFIGKLSFRCFELVAARHLLRQHKTAVADQIRNGPGGRNRFAQILVEI